MPLLEEDRPAGKVVAPGPLGDPAREVAPGDGPAAPALDEGGIRGGALATLGDECRYAAGHQRHPPEATCGRGVLGAAWDLKMGGICSSIVGTL